MKQKNLFLGYCVIALILFSYGCTNEPDNVAISSDGVEISFDKQGKGEPTLVFVHGWTNNRSIWDAQMSHFSEKYRVIAVDLAGHGQSGDNRTTWTMSSFGEDVVAVINQLKLDQVVLVGFSMGGPVIIEAAKKAPEHVAGLVLVDNLQNIEMKIPPEMIGFMDSLMMDLVTNPTNEKLVSLGFYKRNPDASFERVLSFLKDGPRPSWNGSINEYFKWCNDDCIESLKKIQTPIIAINSDSEPTNVEAFREYVPSFKVKIVPDVGHLIFWDAPEEFNRLLEESIQEFLNE
ncbi:MAG: alpha/beta hydrolase [Bacteroidales bacterium]|nr:alpha/beta hydrolase [Bacteroidales bacterium]